MSEAGGRRVSATRRRHAAARWLSFSSPSCSTRWRSASDPPILPKLVESFVDNDTATRGAHLRPVRHRLGADAVLLLADPRRAVGPVRAAAGGAAVEFRAGAGLCADGAGAVAGLAVHRPRDLGHHLGQHLDRLCLHRRCHAAGDSARRCSARSALRSAPASFWVRRSAACSAASIRGCRSGSRRRLSFANALYGWLILPESLPPERRCAVPLEERQSARRAASAAFRPRCSPDCRSPISSRSSPMSCCRRPSCSMRPIATAGTRRPSALTLAMVGICADGGAGRSDRADRRALRRTPGAAARAACGAIGFFIFGAPRPGLCSGSASP